MFGKNGTVDVGNDELTADLAIDARDAADDGTSGAAARTETTTINVSATGKAFTPLPRLPEDWTEAA